ncbi:hypothetical protein M758_12G105600 [Ceratodon purpureus]|nr:hypothetical protein M758_12G105600 [Ceratodon purpureus]
MSKQDPPDEDVLRVQCDDPPKPPIPLKEPVCPGPRPHQLDLEMNPETTKPGEHQKVQDVEAVPKTVDEAECSSARQSDRNLRDRTCEGDMSLTRASTHGLNLNSGEETIEDSAKDSRSVQGVVAKDPALASSSVTEEKESASVSVSEVDTDDPVDLKMNPEITKPGEHQKVQDVEAVPKTVDEAECSSARQSDRNLRDRTCEGDMSLTRASTHGLNLNSGAAPLRGVNPLGWPYWHHLLDLNDQLSPWEKALRSENVDELCNLVLGMNAKQFVKCDSRRGRGQTALHIAAQKNAVGLAVLILDRLIVLREESYTVRVFPGNMHRDPYVSENYGTVGEYIQAVERKSRKTAYDLAKEQNGSEQSEIICEKIIETLNRSEAHVSIDRAVGLRKELLFFLQESEMVKSIMNDEREREQGLSDLMGRIRKMLGKVISIRDCDMLTMYLNDLQDFDDYLSDPICGEYRPLWQYKDVSGRTMLHVAVMQGCFSLAKQLLDMAGQRKDLDYIEAIDTQSGYTAFKMANDIVGNKSIAGYINNTLESLKNPVHESSKFSEAYPRTSWYRALKGEYGTESGSFLYSQLLKNYELLLQTYNDITVLHAAILFKDKDLFSIILDLFGREKKVSFGVSCYPSELTWLDMFQKKACVPGHMSDKKSTMQWIEHFIQEGGDHVDTFGDFREMLNTYDSIGLEPLEKRKYATYTTWFRRLEDPWFRGLEDFRKFEYHINTHWASTWDKEYEVDVDFNFEIEPRRTLLKVHYACKYPLKFKVFLGVMLSFLNESEYDVFFHDGQGRTMFHILVDHCNTQVRFPGRWILKEIWNDMNERYKTAHDARGRTVIDILLTKNYLQHNIFLQPVRVMQYDFDFMKSGIDKSLIDDDSYNVLLDYDISFMLYHVATILKQTAVAQHIWSTVLEKDSKQLRKKLCGFEPLPFIASSTGNQVLLQMLMELEEADLLIHDASGRTLLHHAADHTLLEFGALLKCPMIEHCFSTVMDLCEVQKKWNEERKKTAMILPSRESEKQSGVEELVTINVKSNTSRLVSRESENQLSDVGKVVASMNVERKACILLLLQAGVDLSQEDKFKKTPNIGPNDDPTFQSWWYDLVVKDSTDKKNSFNQAASALSVVATLVAATSYIGPLQPPMNYTNGWVNTSVKLVRMFMVTNSLAFYLAMMSVILAVVPALPMPRESVVSELKRARHILSVSLYLLLMSIVCIILSFGAASTVVMHDQYSFPGSDLLFFPTILGCLLCFIAIVSFLIRVMKLTFYNSPTIRSIYQFSITKFCKRVFQWCTARLSPAETASPKPASKSLLRRNEEIQEIRTGFKLRPESLLSERIEGSFLSERIEGSLLSERIEGSLLSERNIEGSLLSERNIERSLLSERIEGSLLSERNIEGSLLSGGSMS